MKFKKEVTEKRLKYVPLEKRVYAYDASIIIDFLNQTFMPLEYFCNAKGLIKITQDGKITSECLKDPALVEKTLSLGTIYDYYKLFREQTAYTAEVESRYKFSVILKKLSYGINGWQLEPKRVGRSQLIYFYPVMLRVKASQEDRKNFPPKTHDLSKRIVEATAEDHDNETIGVDLAEPGGDKTIEIKPEQFKEAKFFVEVKVDPPAEDW